MSKAIIMVGNVGSGKTTWIKNFIKEQKEEWLVVSKDVLRTMLGGGYYLYDESLEASIDYITKKIIKELLQINRKIIIDETNMDVITRADLIECVYEAERIQAVVMPVISKEISMKRKSLIETNYGYSVNVWEDIWERKNSLYVEPSINEGFDCVLLETKNE